jgi:hypothetical protein
LSFDAALKGRSSTVAPAVSVLLSNRSIDPSIDRS